MSLAVIHSRALNGLEAPAVTVEVHLANGLPSFTLVGLPDAEVRESRERVRAALLTSGFDFPARRITVNLAPADLPKDSGRFDLPIALGILQASGQLAARTLEQYELAGELALDGGLRPVRGALPLVREARSAGRQFILPQASAAQAALLGRDCVLGATSLLEVCAHLNGIQPLTPPEPEAARAADSQLCLPDLADVLGQHGPRRALEVAAAGGHNLLLIGPPGTGKSMLASRLPGILPPLSAEQLLDSIAIHSLQQAGGGLSGLAGRPFRAPHHSASAAALVGGGSDPRPGEISLAHHGVLFLDELPEFDRRVLEMLREPLESGQIHISRAARQATFPARFQLVAAMNPCPCGYLGHPQRACRCTPDQVARYRGKLSGPLLDRIDLHVEVPAQPLRQLTELQAGESSASVRERVQVARERQLQRQGCLNAELAAAQLPEALNMQDEARQTLLTVAERLQLSARAYHRLQRVARTLADLAGESAIGRAQVLEAVQLRRALPDGGAP